MKRRILQICLSLILGIGTHCVAGSAGRTSGSAADSGPGVNRPKIVSVTVAGTNLVVVVSVPPGLSAVTLEGRGHLAIGSWAPTAVRQLTNNTDGVEITLRLPMTQAVDLLRVRADSRMALPSSFYQGTNAFAEPSSGSGVVDASGRYQPGSGTITAGAVPAAGDASPTQPRTVVESDIWKVQGNRLYFFNQYRGLQVIDLSDPNAPSIRGTFDLPAAGEQMYLMNTNYAVLLVQGCGWGGNDDNDVVVVDATGTNLVAVASLPVAGSIQASRLVGSALYVASQVWRPVPGTSGNSWEWGTLVSSFDLSTPAQPVARGTLWYSSSYGSVVTATDRFFFLAIQDNTYNNWWQSVVHIIDISDLTGVMKDVGKIQPAGQVTDKFKMDLNGDIFTVISEAWNSVTRWTPTLETFSLANPASPRQLRALQFTSGEQLHATRFDGDRVYVVTFKQIDPLWVVDLSNPAEPRVAGRVEVPGWSTYIEPLGDKLVTIGVQTNNWQVAVSLFDVTDPASPTLVSRVSIGDSYSWSEANYDEKAFGVFPDAGLILVPYAGYYTNGYATAVQLIDLNTNLATADALKSRGVIQRRFQPRRATVYGDRLLTLSGRELLSVDAANRDAPTVVADLELSWPVDRLFLSGDYVVEIGNGNGWDNQNAPTLHVALAADPNRAVAGYSLTNLPVLGAAVGDQRLYIVQGPGGWYPPIYAADAGGAGPVSTNPPNFFLAVLDLTKLPAVTLLGQTGITNTTAGWNAGFQAVWPKPGLVVWAGGAGYWPLPLMAPMGAPLSPGGATATGGVGTAAGSAGPGTPMGGTPAGLAPILWPWWGWGANNGQLLAFDVSDPANPTFLSEVNLATTNRWGFSAPIATNDLVYLSHTTPDCYITGTNYWISKEPVYTIVTNGVTVTSSDPPPLASGPVATNYITVTNATPIYDCISRSYLDVVDYHDPVNPTVRVPVNIPGALQGLDQGGALLYTTGQHWTTNGVNDWTQWLDASAYDGVSAHLIDSLALSTNWPHPLLAQGTNIFIGRPADSTNAPDQLQVWTLPETTGKFSQESAVSLKAPASALAAFGNLLAVQEQGTAQLIQLFDTGDAANLRLTGAGQASGCLWYNLANADGALDRGVWLPLGDYGATHFDSAGP